MLERESRDDVVALTAIVVLGGAIAIATGVSSQFSELLIAFATAAVAVFSWGTWRLYQLERERRETVPEKLAARMVRIGFDFHEAAELAGAFDQAADPDSNWLLADLVIGRIDVASQQLGELFEEAVVVSEETAAVIGAAESNAVRVITLIKALGSTPTDTDPHESLLEQALSMMRGTSRELIYGGQALPGSGLGDRGKNFARQIQKVSNRITDTDPEEDLREALRRVSGAGSE